MKRAFQLEDFISRHVTKRDKSLTYYDVVANDPVLRSRIEDRRVLVIGGAGSIGSACIKAMLPYNPAALVVVDINENGLTELTRDLRSTHELLVPPVFLTYPMSFDAPVFERMFRQEGPFHIVANFAAPKHVLSEKDRFAIEAMLENNVLQAKHLLDLLVQFPPERFFCVSTDKAANPANVMGAGKKLMENLLLAYADRLPVTTARFANVAFSNGSLPDGFLQRIAKNQPLSAPKDIRRYFVSPREAGEICLLACVAGEPGNIFFPKLDESQLSAFTDIAIALLHELGYKIDYCHSEDDAREKAARYLPDADYYPVYFFDSDTSGEKPFEEFVTEGESARMDVFQSLGVIAAKAPHSLPEIEAQLDRLREAFLSTDTDKSDLVALMRDLIPTFSHIETGKSLDQKM